MFKPTHFLTSNFNLMDTNSNWKILKKKGVFIDKNYNGLSLSLNKKNLNIYDSFHAIFYLDSFNGISFKTENNGDQTSQCVLELDEERAMDILIELSIKFPAQAMRWGKRAIKEKNNGN